MSAPVMMESSRAPIDLPVAEQASGLNFLSIVRRRWPWVLVGVFIGVVGGLLAYSARPSIYQSNAQVLVIKKREGGTLGPTDGRMGMMEDYMATQATILKSEKVLTSAHEFYELRTKHVAKGGVDRSWLGEDQETFVRSPALRTT